MESLSRVITLGPLNLPLYFIALAMSWLIYRIVIRQVYRKNPEQLKLADGILFNAVFILIIVWKLSPLIFQFKTVVSNPIAVLYLPGGASGVILGLVTASGYTVWKFLKIKEGKTPLFRSLGLNASVLILIILITGLITGFAGSRFLDGRAGGAVASDTQVPDFSISGESGDLYNISDFAGKTIVLNFWASWCPPCRAEMPELKAFYTENKDEDVVFLSVNLTTSEQNREALESYLEDEKMPFPVYFDRTGEASQAFDISSIPITVIIRDDGIIDTIRSGAITKAWLEQKIR